MPHTEHPARAAAHSDPATPIDMGARLFAILELSLPSWMVTASAPGENKAGEHDLTACDGPGLLALLRRLQKRAERRCGRSVAVVAMQEAGRDGFWAELAERRRGRSRWKASGGPSPTGRVWSAQPGGGPVLDCGEPAQPPRQNGPDRCRGDAVHADGLGTR